MVLFIVLGLTIPASSQQGGANSSTQNLGASQQSSATPASQNNSSPLPTPSITGPLQAAPPINFDAGPFGRLSLNGVLSGFGLTQTNHVAGDSTGQAALSDAQVFIQKADGPWQFYVQAGAYNILSLGTPYTPTGKQVSDLYGPVPVAYLKLVPNKSTSIEIGELPTLMGAEYTFDFENMNIERGLLWNQENAINRGIQVNQTLGKFAASLSWNDGYYSNRYSWLSGSLTYTQGPHALAFVGMGNLGHTRFQTAATPVQNNSSMYALEYTYTKGNWIIQPYYQYSDVPTDSAAGIGKGASTQSGAVLLSRTLGHGFSLAGRGEYIASTGSVSEGTQNLLYGSGSSAWSATATPTFQRQRFFARGDISIVRAMSFTVGDAFGQAGADSTQARGVLELGFLF
ncbi:MAG: outer membrane beta-barrel protein [Silvibacterium sp.]